MSGYHTEEYDPANGKRLAPPGYTLEAVCTTGDFDPQTGNRITVRVERRVEHGAKLSDLERLAGELARELQNKNAGGGVVVATRYNGERNGLKLRFAFSWELPAVVYEPWPGANDGLTEPRPPTEREQQEARRLAALASWEVGQNPDYCPGCGSRANFHRDVPICETCWSIAPRNLREQTRYCHARGMLRDSPTFRAEVERLVNAVVAARAPRQQRGARGTR